MFLFLFNSALPLMAEGHFYWVMAICYVQDIQIMLLFYWTNNNYWREYVYWTDTDSSYRFRVGGCLSIPQPRLLMVGAAGYASRAPPQYEDCLSRYGDFPYKDTTVMRQSDPHKGNSYTGKTASLYWDGPRFHLGTSLWRPSWYIPFTQNKWNSCNRVKGVICPLGSGRDSHDKNPKCCELAQIYPASFLDTDLLSGMVHKIRKSL